MHVKHTTIGGQSSTALTLFLLMLVQKCQQNGYQQSQLNMRKHESLETLHRNKPSRDVIA